MKTTLLLAAHRDAQPPQPAAAQALTNLPAKQIAVAAGQLAQDVIADKLNIFFQTNPPNKVNKRLHQFINHNQNVSLFIYGLIILNLLAIILESFESIRSNYETFFSLFEIFSVAIFSIEYLLRIISAGANAKNKENKTRSRIKYLKSPLGIIDLLAILPFYLPLIFPMDLRVIRILRLFRLLRLFKLDRYSKAFQTIMKVLNESKSELAITAFVAFVLLLVSSTLMFFIEAEAQPENFASIGHSLWWAVATLTTVGYGDVYPITFAGKILSAIISLIGIGFVALPTGIISNAFIERIKSDKVKKPIHQCPNCGNKIHV